MKTKSILPIGFLGVFFTGIALTLSCTASNFGPECEAYLGVGGCCQQAAGSDSAALAACDQAAVSANSTARDQAEAVCKTAHDQAIATGRCGSPGSDGGASPACTRYLNCVAKAAPEQFPTALASYGPASPCWSSTATAPACTNACLGALDTLRKGSGATLPECAACATSTDCWSAQPMCDPASKLCVSCNEDAQCAGALCNAHRCEPGCRIDGVFRAPGSGDPTSTCRKCDPAMATSEWSHLADGISCGGGMACLGGYCGGPKFTAQSSGTINDLYGVWGSSSRDVFAVGTNGTIVHTSDGGVTWTRQTSGFTTTAMNAVWGSGRNDVYVASDDGSVLHSTDGGATWPRVRPTGSVGRLTGVWGSAANDVYVVGDVQNIYHSTDGGMTWTHQGTSGPNLWGIWGTGATDIYAVGEQGTILHTKDHGMTWTRQSTGVVETINSVGGSGKNDVFAVGQAGRILVSTDSGTTWTAKTSGVTVTLYGAWARGAKERYAVGSTGTLLFNTGGTAWTALPAGATSLFAIWANGTDTFVVGAAGGVQHSP